MVHILPLNHTNPEHIQFMLSMVVQSVLDYGTIDSDGRLFLWNNGQGVWAAALDETRRCVGIVCIVHVDDHDYDALFWLEVLPTHRRLGIGTQLFMWAQRQARTPLIVRSVPSARGFYQQLGVVYS